MTGSDSRCYLVHYCFLAVLLFCRIDKNQDMKIDWVEWRDYFDLRSAESLEDILKSWRCPPVSIVIYLCLPSEWSETGGHYVFTFVCVSVRTQPIGLNGRNAEKYIQIVREKLRIFPYRQYIVGNVILLAFW